MKDISDIVEGHCASEWGGRETGKFLFTDDEVRALIAKEREACAEVCEEVSDEYKLREGMKYPEARTDAQEGADMCANKIRARQEPQG